MMKEYYPADYEQIERIHCRWSLVSCRLVDGRESDVNSPSAESIIRQILYGNQFFRREFGKTSAEYMLPDCFGFPARSRASWRTWVSRVSPLKNSPGIQRRVRWAGFDRRYTQGNPVQRWLLGRHRRQGRHRSFQCHRLRFATLSQTSAKSSRLAPRVQTNGEVSGLFVDYHYYGTGDTGGAPQEASVKAMEAILTRTAAVFPLQLPTQASAANRGQSRVQVGDGPLTVFQLLPNRCS